MANTDFAALTDNELTVWMRKVVRAAREKSFITKFEGSDENAMIHRINALTETTGGAKAVMTLVTDLEDDGVAGDRNLEGNEEAMVSSDIVIQIDQLRHAVRNKGRMANQRAVVKFREVGMNNLSYWLANRYDQMALLTLSGISYTLFNNGATRPKQEMANLAYAADVTAPSANRHYRWNGTSGLFEAGNTANVEATDTMSYDFVVNARTLAEDAYLKPLRMNGDVEWYNLFLTPHQIAQLKLDDDFKEAYRNAMPRTPDNPLFKGSDVIWLDGMAIHKHRYVYNTRGAASGSKWGAAGAIDGARALLCGAQALGKAEVGRPIWVEKDFDYDNQPGIASGRICGFRKPKFQSIYSDSVEDFGVIAIDTAG